MSVFGVVLFAVLILFSVGLHEFGHFITAKKFGAKVEQFFIGFGPKIWSTKRGETEYGVKALPLGGFVRIAGMNPFEEVPEEDRDRVFSSRKPWQRAIVLAAGSFTHFLIAFVIIAVVLGVAGFRDPNKPTTTIGLVEPTVNGAISPAAQAGISPGDTVVAIEGVPVTRWTQAQQMIRAHPNEVVHITIKRGSFERTATVRLSTTKVGGKTVGLLGVQSTYELRRYGPFGAMARAGQDLGDGIVGSYQALYHLFSPSTLTHLFKVATGSEARRATDPATLVGAGGEAAASAKAGDFVSFFLLIAALNIFIGVANLLPLPPLDGGHLAVLAYEKVRRRHVDMRRLIPVSAAVISVLGTLFLVLLYLDIVRPLPAIPG